MDFSSLQKKVFRFGNFLEFVTEHSGLMPSDYVLTPACMAWDRKWFRLRG